MDSRRFPRRTYKMPILPLVGAAVLIVGVLSVLGCTSEPEVANSGVQSNQVADSLVSDTRDRTVNPDFATPEEAIRAYYLAVDANDFEAGKQVTVFLTEEYQDAYLAAMMTTPLATKNYNRAVREVFGETAKTFPSIAKQFLVKLETIPVEYTNTIAAVWNHQPDKQLKLIKHGDGWLLDLREMEKIAPNVSVFRPLHEMASYFTIVADKIEEGELTTGEAIRDEFIRLNSKN